MKRMTYFLLSLGLACLLFSCGGKEKKREAPAIPERKAPVSALQFSYEEFLDLGAVFEMERREGSFSVKNVSEKVQRIKSVAPTCECLTLAKPFEPLELQPGESFDIVFEMNAATVEMNSFLRYFMILTAEGQKFQAKVGGRIVRPMTVVPSSRILELGLMKNPAEQWSRSFTIQKSPDLEGPLVLGEELQSASHLSAVMVAKGDDTYEVIVTPKGTLPYTRKFSERVRVPILQPEKAGFLDLTITAQVGEAVNFAPDNWKIVRSKLEEAGQFTERFAYGEVPGLQEEKYDGVRDVRNMMKTSLLRQHNAVPLKFVKENHDWDDLFAHLEYEVPAGVTLEKIRHPQGIELKITVTKEAFAETTSVQVVPFRDGNRCAPITIQVVD